MNGISIFLLVFLFYYPGSVNCQSLVREKRIEVIEQTTRHYYQADTTLSKPFWDLTDKIWFKDSFAIEEVRQLEIQENYKGVVISQYYILCHYRFSDLRKGFVYEFGDFSDTALLIRKYTFGDSVKVFGGWGFNHKRTGEGTYIFLPDAVIDNIIYKRARVHGGTKELPYTTLCYFRCDKKGTVFDLVPAWSEATGCPLVKTYTSSPIKRGMHFTNEVKFVADTLTENESKVFAAWEKYAAMNPVVK